MANGTIAFDTLSTSGQITGTAVSVDADYLAHGSAKAWINFDATSSNNIDDSFNTASIQDDATGNHRVNFTNNFGNTNYLHIGCTAGDGGTTGDHGFVPYNNQSGGTTSQSFQLRPSQHDGNRRDCNNVYHMSNGDLA